jgi:hypothetical protein
MGISSRGIENSQQQDNPQRGEALPEVPHRCQEGWTAVWLLFGEREQHSRFLVRYIKG